LGFEEGGEAAAETEEVDVDGDGGRLTVGSVNRLRRRLQASQRLNCMLVAERARNAALLGEMRRLVGVLPGQGIKTEPAAAPGEEEDGKKSWRRERLEYVETATRKHLENVRGVELGENGEVRDGEWEGGGPSLEKGEVESLERVIGMLGGSRQEQEQDRMDES
jgi:kinetochore protein Mis12/MTW1